MTRYFRSGHRRCGNPEVRPWCDVDEAFHEEDERRQAELERSFDGEAGADGVVEGLNVPEDAGVLGVAVDGLVHEAAHDTGAESG